MKTLLVTLALVLWPFTVKAQVGFMPDSTDILYRRLMDSSYRVLSRAFDRYDSTVAAVPDSTTMFTLGQVRRMIDSALAAQGEWRPQLVDCNYLNADSTGYYRNYDHPCTTWVWARPMPQNGGGE